jgi:hypothetical protein
LGELNGYIVPVLLQRPICYPCVPLNNPLSVSVERFRLFVALVPGSLTGTLGKTLFAAAISRIKDSQEF